MNQQKSKKRNPLVASLLCLVVPGLGQLYNGQLHKALIFFGLKLIILISFVRVVNVFTIDIDFDRALRFILVYVALALTSMVDAFLQARRIQEIALKIYQRWYVYFAVYIISFCFINFYILNKFSPPLKQEMFDPTSWVRNLESSIAETERFHSELEDELEILEKSANAKESQGKYLDAISDYKKIIELDEKMYGKNATIIAPLLQIIAGLYYDAGKFDMIDPFYNRAFEIQKSARGLDDPRTMGLIRKWSDYGWMAGKPDEAYSRLQWGMKEYEKVFGPTHEHIGTFLYWMAELREFYEDSAKAESLYQQALEIYKKTLEPKDKKITDVYESLSRLKKK